jgi:hypothetical protein
VPAANNHGGFGRWSSVEIADPWDAAHAIREALQKGRRPLSENVPADSGGKMVVFGAKQIRRVWHEEQWFFSVVDIIGALTDGPNPRDYWYRMKRREKESSGIELSTLCRRLRNKDAQGFVPNKRAAQEGGTVAGNARRQLEVKSGRRVVTRQNYLAGKPKPKLPPKWSIS